MKEVTVRGSKMDCTSISAQQHHPRRNLCLTSILYPICASPFKTQTMYRRTVFETALRQRLLQSSQNSVISILRLVVGVEQQRVTRRPPRVAVTNTPDGDTNTISLAQASLDHISPVRLLSILNVNLSQRTLGSSSTESGHGSRCVGALARGQVTLRTNTVDGDARGDPLLDVADHALRLRVRSGIETTPCQNTRRAGKRVWQLTCNR